MNEISIINEPKTLTQIVKVAPTLPTIGKKIREGENPLKTIQTSLTLILTMYGYSSNDEEFTILTSTFMDNAKLLTILDIKLFTKKCLAGDYNDKYKPKFQLHFLMEWLKEYKDERMSAAETMPTYKAIESEPLTERSKEIITQILERTKPKPLFSTDEPTKSDRDKFIKKQWDYFKFKFNEVWKGQGMTETDELSPREYVTFGSKMYFKNDYIKMMVEKDLVNYDKKITS